MLADTQRSPGVDPADGPLLPVVGRGACSPLRRERRAPTDGGRGREAVYAPVDSMFLVTTATVRSSSRVSLNSTISVPL